MIKNKKYNNMFLLCVLLPSFLNGMIGAGKGRQVIKRTQTVPQQFPKGPIQSQLPIYVEPISGEPRKGLEPHTIVPKKPLPTFLPQSKEGKIATISLEDIQEIQRAEAETTLKNSLLRYEKTVIPKAKKLNINVELYEKQIPRIKTAENISQNRIDATIRVLLALEEAIEAKELSSYLNELYTMFESTHLNQKLQFLKDIVQSFMDETDVQKLQNNNQLFKEKVKEIIKNYADELVIKAENLAIESDVIEKFKKAMELVKEEKIPLTDMEDLALDVEEFEIAVREKESKLKENEQEKLRLAQQEAQLKVTEEQKIKEIKELDSKIAQQEKKLEKDIELQEYLKEEIDIREKELKELDVKKEETIMDKPKQEKVNQEIKQNQEETEELERKLQEKTTKIEQQQEIIEKEKQEVEESQLKESEATVTTGQKQSLAEVPESTSKTISEEVTAEIPTKLAETAVEKPEIPKEPEATVTTGQKQSLQEMVESPQKTIAEQEVKEVSEKPTETAVEKPEIPKEPEATITTGQKQPLEETVESPQKTIAEQVAKEVKEKPAEEPVEEVKPEELSKIEKEERVEGGGEGEVPKEIKEEIIKEQKEEEKKELLKPILPITPQEEIISLQEQEGKMAEVKPEITPETSTELQLEKEKPSITFATEYQPTYPEAIEPGFELTPSSALTPTGTSQPISPMSTKAPTRAAESPQPFKPSISDGGRGSSSATSVSSPGMRGITTSYTQRIDLGPRVADKVVTPPAETKIEKQAQPQPQVWWEKLLPKWVVQYLGRKDRIIKEEPIVVKPEPIVEEEEKPGKKEAGVIETIIEVVKKPIINAINYIRGLFGFS